MRKKLIFVFIIFGLLVAFILVNRSNQKGINIISDNAFAFNEVSFGESEEKFRRIFKDAVFWKKEEGVFGNNNIYVREYEFLGRPLTEYYSFSENGFQKGWYEIVINKDEEADFLDDLYKYVEPILEEANEWIRWTLEPFKKRFAYTWEQFYNSNERIRLIDGVGGVLVISRYNLENVEEQRAVNICIYQGSEEERSLDTYGGWDKETEECWNAENEVSQVKKSGLDYQLVKMVRFEKNSLWVDKYEINNMVQETHKPFINTEPECINYSISSSCSIWGLLSPASYGIISYEELVISETSAKEEFVEGLWHIGINENGEIEHIYQQYLQ